MKIKKKSGFTLAEVLITLTIIGIIAAMTVPTLISKYQKQTYVVGLKRAYAQLKHAIQLIPITEGCSSGDYECTGMSQDWGKATDIDGMSFEGKNSTKDMYLISKNLKIKKFCPAGSNDSECIKFNAIMPKYDSDDTYSLAQLEDGSIFSQGIGSCIDIDVNGLKGPNLPGRDQFRFRYTLGTYSGLPPGTVYPEGSKLDSMWGYWKDATNYKCDSSYPKKENKYAQANLCAGRVLEEGAMNY